jgi:hypothetical protein
MGTGGALDVAASLGPAREPFQMSTPAISATATSTA